MWFSTSILAQINSMKVNGQTGVHTRTHTFLQSMCLITNEQLYIGLDKHNFEHKIVNSFLPISFNICFGCSKEPSLLSTHNICFR